MSISQKYIKILWANSAGRCSFSGCGLRLCSSEAGEFAPFTIGEMAHIRGERPGANRHNPDQNAGERNSYSNLILLCPTHHRLIDKTENEDRYDVDALLRIKQEHETNVAARLEEPAFSQKKDVALYLLPFLAENFEIWRSYGPLSDLARDNPHNNSAYAVWRSERLSTIVPNNRRMLAIVNANKRLFSTEEQARLATFVLHVRSYESWVENDIAYSGVLPFPHEFDELIREIANASA